jgi:hypothetical protein
MMYVEVVMDRVTSLTYAATSRMVVCLHNQIATIYLDIYGLREGSSRRDLTSFSSIFGQ